MTRPSDFSNRETYRRQIDAGLPSWRVAYKDTELFICAESLYEKRSFGAVTELRRTLDDYILKHPEFLKTLVPVEPASGAPEMVHRMCRAGFIADVGPMAAVAGAFAEYVGRDLLKISRQVIVENGGDIFMKTDGKRTVAVYAGKSPLSMKIGIAVDARDYPVSVCTSSGTIGPSLSFGAADAAVIVSNDACIADACATRLGNDIKSSSDIQSALDTVYGLEGVIGAMAVVGETCGAVGNIELISLKDGIG